MARVKKNIREYERRSRWHGKRERERGRWGKHSKMSSSDPDLRRREIGGGNLARPETEKFSLVRTFIGALRERRFAIKNVDVPRHRSSSTEGGRRRTGGRGGEEDR